MVEGLKTSADEDSGDLRLADRRRARQFPRPALRLERVEFF